jgi:phospholipid/cholesterol/gamma-HCH transport system substrate-binding protein
MESRAHAIIAGLFTVVLGIGVVLAALWFSRENYDHVTYVLESKHSVSGLNSQAPVRLRGVQIGKVQSIAFDEDDARLILITISVKDGSKITRGTSAQLGAQGITGTSYVMLEDDGKDRKFLPPSTEKAGRIPVKRSLFDEIADSGQDMLAQAMGTVDTSLPALVADARKMMDGANGAVRDMAPALREARTTLASIENLAREYAQRAGALDSVAKSAEQISSASQGIGSAVSSGMAPRMNALLDELARNSRSLDRLLLELNERPAGLVFGRTPGRPGPGENGFTPPESSQK